MITNLTCSSTLREFGNKVWTGGRWLEVAVHVCTLQHYMLHVHYFAHVGARMRKINKLCCPLNSGRPIPLMIYRQICTANKNLCCFGGKHKRLQIAPE